MRKVHGVNLSPFVRKVRVALAEKNLPYELNPVFPGTKTPEFSAISPLNKVPVLEEDGWTVPDSSVIIAYLERTNPKPALYPADPREFAQALFIEEYADTRLVEKGIPIFVELVVNKRFMQKEPDQERVRKAREEDLPPVLDHLESQIADPAGIVSGRFSVADIAIGTQFVGLKHAGYAVDGKRWPKLAKYLATICARPSFSELVEEEQAMLA